MGRGHIRERTVMSYQFYVKHPEQWADVEAFSLMMLELADVEFYQPAPVVAPWHWQASVNGVTFNFWPHRNKWNREGEKARYGWREAKRAVLDQLNDDAHPLLEDE